MRRGLRCGICFALGIDELQKHGRIETFRATGAALTVLILLYFQYKIVCFLFFQILIPFVSRIKIVVNPVILADILARLVPKDRNTIGFTYIDCL